MKAMSDDYEPDRHITEAEYRAWLERQRPKLAAELTEFLPQEVRDAGMRFEWVPDTPTCSCKDILVYDMVLPKWPYEEVVWTPFRDRIPRATRCYRLASGAWVHTKPGCRC